MLIRIFYVIGLIWITGWGALAILGAIETRAYFGSNELMWLSILWGVAILVLGNLLWRILCELVILLFNIHGHLSSIRNQLSHVSGDVREPFESITQKFSEGVLQLSAISEELKEGISHAELRESLAAIAQRFEEGAGRLARVEQALKERIEQHNSPSKLEADFKPEEWTNPRRRSGIRWILLILLLLLVGVFVGLPIASGHSQLQSLDPQDISSFFTNIWAYWLQVVKGGGG
jgi:hypothetical protein